MCAGIVDRIDSAANVGKQDGAVIREADFFCLAGFYLIKFGRKYE